MRSVPRKAAYILLAAMFLSGCISTSDSGRVYMSTTPLFVIGGIVLLIAFLRR